MKEVRVITKAWSKTVAPDLVLDREMSDDAAALRIAGAGLPEK